MAKIRNAKGLVDIFLTKVACWNGEFHLNYILIEKWLLSTVFPFWLPLKNWVPERKFKKKIIWKLKQSGFEVFQCCLKGGSEALVLLFFSVCWGFRLGQIDNAPIGRVESAKHPKTRGRKPRQEGEILAERLLADYWLIHQQIHKCVAFSKASATRATARQLNLQVLAVTLVKQMPVGK